MEKIIRTRIISVVAGTALVAASVAAGQSLWQAPIFDLGGATDWLNSTPVNGKTLRRKIVLIDFWAYTCINSLRPLPYVKTWAAKYKDAGLVVIGVHTPEFSFEKERVNVENAARNLNVTYPVAIDSNYSKVPPSAGPCSAPWEWWPLVRCHGIRGLVLSGWRGVHPIPGSAAGTGPRPGAECQGPRGLTIGAEHDPMLRIVYLSIA